jgi:ABC-type amino acid transport substrate-binding protein
VFPVAPFVMRENGSPSGFNIDLWNAVVARTLRIRGADWQRRLVLNSTPVLPQCFSSLDSLSRRGVSSALIAFRENGTYEQLYTKWFGIE